MIPQQAASLPLPREARWSCVLKPRATCCQEPLKSWKGGRVGKSHQLCLQGTGAQVMPNSSSDVNGIIPITKALPSVITTHPMYWCGGGDTGAIATQQQHYLNFGRNPKCMFSWEIIIVFFCCFFLFSGRGCLWFMGRNKKPAELISQSTPASVGSFSSALYCFVTKRRMSGLYCRQMQKATLHSGQRALSSV